MNRSPNWPAIRHEYMAGFIDEQGVHKHYTLEQLAERHGLAHSTLLSRSSVEGWTAQREAFQARIYEQAFVQFESEMAAHLAESDRLAASASHAMLKHIVNRIERAEDDKERDALVVKFGKMMPDLLRVVHDSYGVDLLLNSKYKGEQTCEDNTQSAA